VRLPQPALGADPIDGGDAAGPGSREVHFASAEGRISTPVLRRTTLAPGVRIEGPAIIEEYSSTTIVAPGESVVVGELGELRLRIAPAQREARP